MTTLKLNFNKTYDINSIINDFDKINENNKNHENNPNNLNHNLNNPRIDASDNQTNIKLNFRKKIESLDMLYNKIRAYLHSKNINDVDSIINHIDNEIKDNDYTDNIIHFYIKNYIHLISKEEIVFKLNNNILKPDDISNLTILDIDSDISSDYERTENKKNEILKSAITSSLFKCPKCNNDCAYTERQDRGADESMTVHIQCQNKSCNHYYKIN